MHLAGSPRGSGLVPTLCGVRPFQIGTFTINLGTIKCSNTGPIEGKTDELPSELYTPTNARVVPAK